jgi:membrane-associated protease RseP (regulator of RpoE activity)
MPREMRFCRSCGYRLGEDIAEFNETIRLPGSASNRRPTAQARSQFTGPAGNTNGYGPIAPVSPGAMFTPENPQFEKWRKRRRKRKLHWIFWVIIAFAIASVMGGSLIPRIGRNFGPPRAPKVAGIENPSFLGGDLFSAPNGAGLSVATPPGGPADKAGLIGGDVITSFDGKAVQGEKQLRQILGMIPAGKTVDVVYVRDGETKNTKLTTISEDEREALSDAFEDPPGGKGKVGINSLKQVDVPGMNIKGIRINEVVPNYPASMAGVEKGDIVIEFDKTPIRTEQELRARIERTTPKKAVTMIVVRGTEKVEIPLKVGVED